MEKKREATDKEKGLLISCGCCFGEFIFDVLGASLLLVPARVRTDRWASSSMHGRTPLLQGMRSRERVHPDRTPSPRKSPSTLIIPPPWPHWRCSTDPPLHGRRRLRSSLQRIRSSQVLTPRLHRSSPQGPTGEGNRRSCTRGIGELPVSPLPALSSGMRLMRRVGSVLMRM
jgi:hypothetical protein